MRSALMLGALTLVLAAQAPLYAQAPKAPDFREVIVDGAELRSGASTSEAFYVTNRLPRSTPVEVLEEMADGWLKVRAPRGSFSWINTRFLEHIVPHLPNWVVGEGEAPVFIGSELLKERPRVIGVKLKKGTQVLSIGPTQTDADGTWMPIEAPAREVRFLRAESVRALPPGLAPNSLTLTGATVPVTTTARSSPGAKGPLAPSTAPSASPQPTAEQVWRNAVEADRHGQIAEAIRLWELAAALTAKSNPEHHDWALRRAYYLHSGHQGYGAVAASPETRYAAPVAPAQPAARLTTPPGSVPARTASTASFAPAPASASPYPTYAGRLNRAGRVLEDRRTYRLDTNTSTILYVTPQPGIDLEPYLQRNAQVTGPLVYHGELRTWVMTVVQVQPLP